MGGVRAFYFPLIVYEDDKLGRPVIMITCQACGRVFEREINEVRIMRNENVDAMPTQFCSYKCEMHGWDPAAVRWAKERRRMFEEKAASE